VFLSPRKHINIPRRATNLDFQKDVLRVTVFEYYDKGEYLTVKKVTPALGEKIAYKGSIHILLIYSYEIAQFYSYVARFSISFLKLLLLQTIVRDDIPAMPYSFTAIVKRYVRIQHLPTLLERLHLPSMSAPTIRPPNIPPPPTPLASRE
jgi:hypothetical protein